jgi:hypothetical protein
MFSQGKPLLAADGRAFEESCDMNAVIKVIKLIKPFPKVRCDLWKISLSQIAKSDDRQLILSQNQKSSLSKLSNNEYCDGRSRRSDEQVNLTILGVKSWAPTRRFHFSFFPTWLSDERELILRHTRRRMTSRFSRERFMLVISRCVCEQPILVSTLLISGL